MPMKLMKQKKQLLCEHGTDIVVVIYIYYLLSHPQPPPPFFGTCKYLNFLTLFLFFSYLPGLGDDEAAFDLNFDKAEQHCS